MRDELTVIAAGRHSRLEEVLEKALENVPFERFDITDGQPLPPLQNRRVLFAVSVGIAGLDENVCRLLNSGSNAYNWVQGETYPVLNTAPVAVSGDLNVSGASAVPIITVASAPSEGATLVIVQYSGNQQTDVKTVSVAADGTFTPDTPFAHKDGCTYKTFLLNPDTSSPLSPAAWLSK